MARSSGVVPRTGENSADLRRSLHGDNICSSLWLRLYGEYPLVGGEIVVTAVIMGLSTSISLESGENVPLDLGDRGQVIGGGDLTKCECISDNEYSFEPAYERVGEIDSGDIITEEDFSVSDMRGAIIWDGKLELD